MLNLNPKIIIALLAAAIVIMLVSLAAIINRGNSTKKRLRAIQDQSGYGDKNQPREQIISSKNFQKTKLASNERVKRITTTMENELKAAGMGDDPIRLLLVWIITVILLPIILSMMNVRMIIIALMIAVAAVGPVIVITMRKKKRMQKFEKQLPPAIDIICNALKAGYTFQYAMNNVAKELDDPISEEFLMAFRETQYGASLSDALKAMAKRTGSADIELLDIAVSVQNDVGGNMIDILTNISNTIKAKHDLEEDIRVKTASGRITGILLIVLPVFLFIMLMVINPEYISLFLEEKLGWIMLGFCVVWECIGYYFVNKIMKVKF